MQSRKFNGLLLPFEIADKEIDYKEECKLLAGFIDHQLKRKTQIEKVRKKHTIKNAMLREDSFLPSETLEKVYYNIFYPMVRAAALLLCKLIGSNVRM